MSVRVTCSPRSVDKDLIWSRHDGYGSGTTKRGTSWSPVLVSESRILVFSDSSLVVRFFLLNGGRESPSLSGIGNVKYLSQLQKTNSVKP